MTLISCVVKKVFDIGSFPLPMNVNWLPGKIKISAKRNGRPCNASRAVIRISEKHVAAINPTKNGICKKTIINLSASSQEPAKYVLAIIHPETSMAKRVRNPAKRRFENCRSDFAIKRKIARIRQIKLINTDIVLKKPGFIIFGSSNLPNEGV